MGCLTLECYVNNLAKVRGARRKGWPTKEGESGRAGDTIGAKENPVGVSLRGVAIGLD